MLEMMTSPLILGPIFPHRILTAEVADLKRSLGCFYYMHLANLLLAHLPHVRNQEVKNEKDSTNIQSYGNSGTISTLNPNNL